MESQERMSDNDIIKALEYCVESGNCATCMYKSNCIDLPQDILNLVVRQKAEIERLTGYNENLQTANTALSNEILDIRNATIKEFEEKLKSHKRRMCGNDNGGLYWDQAVLVDDIDRALKEMTEVEA